ncbi:MAG: response regulator transcription factor [Dehalococcoidales bacterium]|nr:response regulator transcription factor [Dehalococcoidales bacterium]
MSAIKSGMEAIPSANKKITVFIVDNRPLFRHAIRQALPLDIAVTGEAPLSSDVWKLIDELSPDIALVHVSPPLFVGFGVARQIAVRCPKVALVMISSVPDDNQLFQAIKLGALAFLGEDASAEEIAVALRKVGNGQYPINDSLMERPNTAMKILQVFHNLSQAGTDVDVLMTPLTSREREILKYIAEGNANKSIASAMGVGEQTVKNYVASIMRKLKASDRTHAVVLAIQKGWLNLGEISDLSKEVETLFSYRG